MAFDLEHVVPWGRSFEEYVSMFALDGDDLGKRCLGCGDGPASFNRTLTSLGGSVVSVDPIYRFSTDQIASRLKNTFDVVLEQTRQNREEFIWREIPSIEALGEIRMKAMSEFLSDFAAGKAQGRYIEGELPRLPFADRSFDLALCSHFLFLYSGHFDANFHVESVKELCRVASEVRVFPLLELGAVRSRHLDGAVSRLSDEGYRVTVTKVGYEFQKGGNEMLSVRRKL